MSDMERYKHDCVGFCRDILGKELTIPHVALMQALANERESFRRLTVSISELGLRLAQATKNLDLFKTQIEQCAKVELEAREAATRGKIKPIPEELLKFPGEEFNHFEFQTEFIPCTCQSIPCMCGGWKEHGPGVRLVLHRRPDQKGYAAYKVTPSFIPSKPQQVWFEETKPSSSGRTLVQGLLTGGMQ